MICALLREDAEVEFHASPFRYFLARHCFSPDLEPALLEWFESGAPWRLVETDFYEQYEFSMFDAALPENVSRLAAPEDLVAVRFAMGALFDVELDDRVALVAHRLMPGQRISLHNDYLVGQETHRLIVQLNRGLRDEDGGFFMMFNSMDPDDIHRIVRPISGSAIGFEIGENSNHAVSRLHGGERYTLVYSFYSRFGGERI